MSLNDLYKAIDVNIGADAGRGCPGYYGSSAQRVAFYAKVVMTALKNRKYSMAKRLSLKIYRMWVFDEIIDATGTLKAFVYAVDAECRNAVGRV
jgi:hypothetical protein